MSVKSRRPVPHFITLARFTRELGIYHTLAKHLLELGVIEPAGYLDGVPIFLADIATTEKAKAAINQFRARQNRAHQNVRELLHA